MESYVNEDIYKQFVEKVREKTLYPSKLKVTELLKECKVSLGAISALQKLAVLKKDEQKRYYWDFSSSYAGDHAVQKLAIAVVSMLREEQRIRDKNTRDRFKKLKNKKSSVISNLSTPFKTETKINVNDIIVKQPTTHSVNEIGFTIKQLLINPKFELKSGELFYMSGFEFTGLKSIEFLSIDSNSVLIHLLFDGEKSVIYRHNITNQLVYIERDEYKFSLRLCK